MPVIDLAFRLRGTTIPADHGFLLFSAVSELVPEIHADRGVGVFPVPGRLLGDRMLAVTEKSRLVIRIDSDRIGQLLPLAGKTLRLGDDRLQVGVPEVRPLVPAARLYSRLVVIKGFMEPAPFLEAARRQLDTLAVKGTPSLVAPQVPRGDAPAGAGSPVVRRTLRIHDKEVVGFAVRVEGLTAEESVRLQEVGLGGRRRFGCGLFIPDHK